MVKKTKSSLLITSTTLTTLYDQAPGPSLDQLGPSKDSGPHLSLIYEMTRAIRLGGIRSIITPRGSST